MIVLILILYLVISQIVHGLTLSEKRSGHLAQLGDVPGELSSRLHQFRYSGQPCDQLAVPQATVTLQEKEY